MPQRIDDFLSEPAKSNPIRIDDFLNMGNNPIEQTPVIQEPVERESRPIRIDDFLSAPIRIDDFLSAAVEPFEQLGQTISNPIPTLKTGQTFSERTAQNLLAGGIGGTTKTIGQGAQWLGAENIGRKLEKFGTEQEKKYAVKNPTTYDEFAQSVGTSLPLMLGGIAAGAGLGVAGVPAGLASTIAALGTAGIEGLQNAGSTREQALANGLSEQEANSAATKHFITAVPISVVLNKFGIFGESKKYLTKLAKSFVGEATEEGQQQFFQNVYAKEPDKWAGVIKSAVFGGIMGLGGGALAKFVADFTGRNPINENTINENIGQKTTPIPTESNITDTSPNSIDIQNKLNEQFQPQVQSKTPSVTIENGKISIDLTSHIDEAVNKRLTEAGIKPTIAPAGTGQPVLAPIPPKVEAMPLEGAIPEEYQGLEDVFTTPQETIQPKSQPDMQELNKLHSELNQIRYKENIVSSQDVLNKLQSRKSQIESRLLEIGDIKSQSIKTLDNEPAFGFVLQDKEGTYLPIKKLSEDSYLVIDKKGNEIIKYQFNPNKFQTVKQKTDAVKPIRDFSQNNKTIGQAKNDFQPGIAPAEAEIPGVPRETIPKTAGQKMKEKMETQINLMNDAGIPNHKIGEYIQSSLADGAKLADYTEKVNSGEMPHQEAVLKVKADFQKIAPQEETDLAAIVKQGGGEFKGIQEDLKGRKLALFGDPAIEGSSYALPPEQITAENVRARIGEQGLFIKEGKTRFREENPLEVEALKYKTAEEFVKSKPNAVIFNGTLYHNTNNETANRILEEGFIIEDTSKLTSSERGFASGNLGDGIYLSPKYSDNANLWGGESNLTVKPTKPLILYDLKDKAQIPSLEWTDNLKKQGYDGIIVNDPHPRSGGYQVVVFDSKNIKAENIVEQIDIEPEILDKEDVEIQQLTDIWNKAHGKEELKLRKGEPEQLINTESVKSEILKLNNEIFGDNSVNFLEKIVENQSAIAQYRGGIISILDGKADMKDSYFHEAVHKYLDMFATDAERREIYTAVKNKNRDMKALDVEEKVAEEFINYAKTRQGFWGKVKLSLDRIIQRIKSFFVKGGKVKKIYNDILKGEAKNRQPRYTPDTVMSREITDTPVRFREGEPKSRPELIAKLRELVQSKNITKSEFGKTMKAISGQTDFRKLSDGQIAKVYETLSGEEKPAETIKKPQAQEAGKIETASKSILETARYLKNKGIDEYKSAKQADDEFWDKVGKVNVKFFAKREEWKSIKPEIKRKISSRDSVFSDLDERAEDMEMTDDELLQMLVNYKPLKKPSSYLADYTEEAQNIVGEGKSQGLFKSRTELFNELNQLRKKRKLSDSEMSTLSQELFGKDTYAHGTNSQIESLIETMKGIKTAEYTGKDRWVSNKLKRNIAAIAKDMNINKAEIEDIKMKATGKASTLRMTIEEMQKLQEELLSMNYYQKEMAEWKDFKRRLPKGQIARAYNEAVEKGDFETAVGILEEFINSRPVGQAVELTAFKDKFKEVWSRLGTSGTKVLRKMGNSGVKFANMLEKWRRDGAVWSGKYEADLVKAGLPKLTGSEQQSLYNALEGKTSVLDFKLKRLYSIINTARNDFAAKAEAMKITVKGEDGSVYYFNRRGNYFCHKVPPLKTLKDPGNVITKDIIKNQINLNNAQDLEEAEAFLKAYVDYVESMGGNERFLQKWVELGNASSYAEARNQLDKFILPNSMMRLGTLERGREINLPFYDPNPSRVIPTWIEQTARRLKQIEIFGQNNHRAYSLMDNIGQEGFGWKLAQRIYDGAINKILIDPTERQIQLLAQDFTIVTKMALAAIVQPSTAANIGAFGDIKSLLKGLRAAFTKEGYDFALRTGATSDAVMREVAGMGMSRTTERSEAFLKAVGMIQLDKFMRSWAANSGKQYALSIFEKLQKRPANTRLISELNKTIPDLNMHEALKRGYLTKNDLHVAGNVFSTVTQFNVKPENIPVIWRGNPWIEMVFFLKSFSFSQARFVFNRVFTLQDQTIQGKNVPVALLEKMWNKAEKEGGTAAFWDEVEKEGFNVKIKPEWQDRVLTLARFLVLAGLLGEGIQDVRSLIPGKKRPTELFKRLLDNMSIGMLGYIGDAIESAAYGKQGVLSMITGPVYSDIGNGLYNMYQLVHGNHRGALRQGIGIIPAVVPPRFAPAVSIARRIIESRVFAKKDKKDKKEPVNLIPRKRL